MKTAPDMTVPITGRSAVQLPAAADAATGGAERVASVNGETNPQDLQVLPWAMLDDHVGPLWSYVRGAKRMIEVAACTRAGDRRLHANEDAAVVEPMPDGSLVVAVLDGITGSVGVDVGQFRRKLVNDFGLLLGSGLGKPLELVHRLNREARRWLDRVAPDAATGAAMIVVRVEIDAGRIDWASAGDVRLLSYRTDARAWFGLAGGRRARVLNEPALSTASNRLTAAVGQRGPLRIEAGSAILSPGQMLLLSTDGATAPLDETCAVLRAYMDGDRLAGLEGVVNRLDRLAIELARSAADDRTIVALAMGWSS
jgi:serine/threonine protein phosphatase PrpC